MVRSEQFVRPGFSLIELVMVVAILGVVAAIALPRLGSSSERAAINAQEADLRALNHAAELYAAEHGQYPTAAGVVRQLTEYSDDAGNPSRNKSATHIYGPYVRAIPKLTTGPNKGKNGVAQTAGSDVGWIYNPVTGQFTPNAQAAPSDPGSPLPPLNIPPLL